MSPKLRLGDIIIITYFIEKTPNCMCNKSIICGVLFTSGAITFYEGNNIQLLSFVEVNVQCY